MSSKKIFPMNNISDKNVIIVLLVTILVVFAFIFSVKSPERRIIDSPILWKEDFTTILIIDRQSTELKNYFKINF